MGLLKTGILITSLLSITVGCGANFKGVHSTKSKISGMQIPLDDAPPPIQGEEFLKADPNYKPDSYTSLAVGTVIQFRDKFEISLKDARVVKEMGNDHIGMFFKFPKALANGTINLKGLQLKVTKTEKPVKGQLHLTYVDEGLNGQVVELPLVCRYFGEYIDTKRMVSYQSHLTRDCTFKELQNVLFEKNAIILDYADQP